VYSGFVDMSGGSSDDAALGIAHFDAARDRAVLDLIATQTGKPAFNPRDAVRKFAGILKEYGISAVTGDRYAGETFVQDFLDHGIVYRVAQCTKSQIYEALEPRINAGEVELLDVSRLTEQLLGCCFLARGVAVPLPYEGKKQGRQQDACTLAHSYRTCVFLAACRTFDMPIAEASGLPLFLSSCLIERCSSLGARRSTTCWAIMTISPMLRRGL
jgi:hypothetical protein